MSTPHPTAPRFFCHVAGYQAPGLLVDGNGVAIGAGRRGATPGAPSPRQRKAGDSDYEQTGLTLKMRVFALGKRAAERFLCGLLLLGGISRTLCFVLFFVSYGWFSTRVEVTRGGWLWSEWLSLDGLGVFSFSYRWSQI